MEDIVQTISNIFFRPTEFFESVQDETSYTRPWLFFSIGYMIMLFISLAFSIPILLRTPDIGPLLIIFQVFSLFLGIGFAFALPFISSGIAHLGLLIFGAKQGYYNTFKAISYSGIVYVIYGIITSIISGYINLNFTSELNDPSQFLDFLTSGKFGPVIILIVIIIVITLISWIHVLIVTTIGVAKFQQISRARAFFGIIIVPVIIFIFVVMLFGGLLLLVLSQGMSTGMVTLY